MSCRHAWTYDFLAETFPKTFVNNDLKQHRRQQLFERELSLLPATQLLIEEELANRRKRALMRQLRGDLKKAREALAQCHRDLEPQYTRLSQLHRALWAVENSIYGPLAAINIRTKTPQEMRESYKQRRELKAQIKQLTKEINDRLQGPKSNIEALKFEMYKARNVATHALNPATNDQERRTFVRACPVADCRGFLSSRWKCGVCSTNVCSACHEVKPQETEHVCDPNNVETAKLIAKDSKPCPTCGALSIKVSGCSQIWCLSCHTAWNWNTGRVERGQIHAEDYYHYMNRLRGGANTRTHGDVPCGGMPNPNMIYHALHDLGVQHNNVPLGDGTAIDLLNFQRLLIHMYDVDGHRMRPDNVQDNQDLRIKYLLNEIDQDHFKAQIQIREKASIKKREIYQIIQTTFDIASEVFRCIENAPDISEVQRVLKELRALCDHAAEGSRKIAQKYSCTEFFIPVMRPFPVRITH